MASSFLNTIAESFRRAAHSAFPEINQEQLASEGLQGGREKTYLWSGVPRIAKQLKLPPKAVAEQIKAQFDDERVNIEKILPAGFFVVAIKADALARQLLFMSQDAHLGVVIPPRKRVIVDYSSPNVAKELHVGHLRSTIIGDALSRIEEFLEQEVLRLNHVGDWGTQFGLLICHLKERGIDIPSLDLPQLMIHYKEASTRLKNDPEHKAYEIEKEAARAKDGGGKAEEDFELEPEEGPKLEAMQASEGQDHPDFGFWKRSKAEVTKLQAGSAESLRIWEQICGVSHKAIDEIYDDLGISKNLMWRGESFYNPFLAPLVEDLLKRNIAEISEDAVCFFEDQGKPPFILRKADGGYLYATTDAASLKYRIEKDKADRLIYVVDERQGDHFKHLKALGIRAGILDPTKVDFKHAGFGVVCGADKKAYKTRDGKVALLKDLVGDAIDHARENLKQKAVELAEKTREPLSPWSDEDERAAVSLGTAVLRYFELKQSRQKDYLFDAKKMLDTQGNTAVYLLYVLARIRSLKEKAGAVTEGDFDLSLGAEQELASQLIRFADVIAQVDATLEPHHLCEFLYQIAEKFNAFYQNKDCVVIDKEGHRNEARLRLCALTEKVLDTGLKLLGIRSLERM